MAINRTAELNLLRPGLNNITGKYDFIPKIYDKIFDVRTSKMAQERSVSVRLLGLAQLSSEGGATNFDNGAGQRFVYNQEHISTKLGFAVTREALDDNLYASQFNLTTLNLRDSFAQAKEIFGANILNSATVFNPAIGGDGFALCSTSHPVDGYTIANRPAIDIDLNEASLLNAQASIRGNFRDNAGLKIQARAKRLVVPVALEPIAIRLLETELRSGTADNDVNAILSTSGGIPDGYLVHDFLTSNSAWFVLTDKKGLVYYQRTKFETEMDADFTTSNILVKGYERYSFGYEDFRGIYGSFPTQ